MLRDFTTYDWFSVSLVLVAFGFLFLKQLNGVKYQAFLRLLFSKAYFKYKLKETPYFKGFEVIILLLANLIFAQICYLVILEWLNFDFLFSKPIMNLGLIYFVISLVFFFKIYLENLINFCITDHQLLKVYVFYKQMIWSYAIFLSLPTIVFYVFYPSGNASFLLASLGIIGFFYVMNILYFINKNRDNLFRNWYYFILYLCALEIAPYFFIYKLLITA